MKIQIKDLVEFLEKYPEYKGKIYANTRHGSFPIVDGKLIKENSESYELKTKNRSIIGHFNHKLFGNDWKYIGDFRSGDEILTEDGLELVKSINKVESRDLYDIQVETVSEYYANGFVSHNSSLTDAIVFGLFGKTVKDVNQAKIINWKNKKACEVYIDFSIGDIEYKIERGLKPNFLRLYKDGVEINQLSHKTEFQNEIESDILGIDYETFISLIHCNPNTNVSIFTAGKAQKRTLIETLFGLETYSKINKKAQEKLVSIDTKLKEITTTVQLNERYIEDTRSQYEKLQGDSKPIDNSEKIKELTDKIENFVYESEILKALTSTIIDISKIESLSVQLDELREELKKYKDEVVDLKLISKIDSIIISLNKQTKGFEKLEKIIGVAILKEKIAKIEEQIKLKKENIEKSKIEVNRINNEINIIRAEFKHIPSLDHLEDGCECPTCLSPVSISSIEGQIKEKTSIIQEKIDILTKELSTYDVEKEKSEVFNLEPLLVKLNTQLEKERTQKKFNALAKMESLSSKYEDALNASKQREVLVKNESLLQSQIVTERDRLANETEALRLKINAEEERILNEKKALSDQLELEKTNAEFFKEQKRKIEELRVEMINKIDSYVQENETKKQDSSKLLSLKDYFDFIKNICKDENVKQYAISNIIPYINQRANYYLSEAGFNFYLKIDSFLDVEIKGPGITGASYANLSGGESKSVSLALQFALLDVCKIKSSIFPNILILDEILDSAIDAQVIEKMMAIIKTKQLTDNIKVFIVSHRKEVNSIEADSVFQVTKSKGYSSIEEIK